ncbi:uncharacterized protein [Procambarus clarkii]|uniref:uncharacterized protein n=1 Tax=Procambarus clarkii TaxID=6728 RepID=UPI001E675701|nr:uncharacterized protein LOC123754223 [Procambarus clarkii]
MKFTLLIADAVFGHVGHTQRAVTTSVLVYLVHAAVATPTPNTSLSAAVSKLPATVSSLQTSPATASQEDSEIPEDWLQPERICSPLVLLENHFTHYTSFPMSLTTLNRINSCEELEADRQIVVLDSHHNLFPEWLADATLAGECPWQLVKREFIPGTVPPSIIEVGCLCNGHSCSRGGDFQCTAVSRRVEVWTSGPHHYGVFRSHMVTMTTACVCARRHVPRGGEAEFGLGH